MATVVNIPTDTRYGQLGNALGSLVSSLLARNTQQKRDSEWEQAVESVVSSHAPSDEEDFLAGPMNKQEARRSLLSTYKGRKNMLMVEEVLNSIFPENAGDAADYINTETGMLESKNMITQEEMSKYRRAPTGTKVEQYYYDEPTLKPAGALAKGAAVANNLLTLDAHKAKYGDDSKSGADHTKMNMEINALISNNNNLNADQGQLDLNNSTIRERAFHLLERSSEIDTAVKEAFTTKFGYDVSFAKEDVPEVNRAKQLVEDKVLREGLPWRHAVEASVVEAGEQIAEEGIDRWANKYNLKPRDTIKPYNVESESPLARILKHTKEGEEEAVTDVDMQEPQFNPINYVTEAGTAIPIVIPKSVDLSGDLAYSNLQNFLMSRYGFTAKESKDFIETYFELVNK